MKRTKVRSHKAARAVMPLVLNLSDERCSIPEIAAALAVSEEVVRTAMYLAPPSAPVNRKWRVSQCER